MKKRADSGVTELFALFSGFPRDFRLALRHHARRPAFSLLVISTLGLGIGVVVLVLALAEAMLLRPLPFPEADRLVRIMASKGGEAGWISQREIEDLQQHSEVFEHVASYYASQYNVSGDGAPEVASCAISSHLLFETLGARFAVGGPYSAKDDYRRQYRVVLQYDFWQRRFGGDPDIVGRSIVLDSGNYTVDGVLASGTDFPAGVQLYRQVTEYHGLDGRRHSVLARLREGASLEQAQQELHRFGLGWQEKYPELNRGVVFRAVPLRDSWVGEARPYLLTLVGAAFFVLAIAIANAVNLLLSRAGERTVELQVRASLGAGRWRLLRQLCAESLVLAIAGGICGLALTGIGLPLIRGFSGGQLPAWMEIRLEPSTLSATLALVLGAAVIAGLLPALASAGKELGQGLRAGTRRTSGIASAKFRSGLVVAEIALALALLVGAGLMVRSFLALERQELGFDADNLYTVRVDPPYWTYQRIDQTTPFYDQALANLAEIPGVIGVAANQNLPLAGLDENNKRVVTLEGQSASEQESNPFIHLQSVSTGYFEVMEIPLLRGRAFGPEDREGTMPVTVLSQHLAERLWPEGSAVGRRLKLGPPESEASWLTVVGVVGDVRSERRDGGVSSDLYLSHFQHFTGDSYIALRTPLEGADFLRRVEAAIQRADGDLPLFDIATMHERIARVDWQRRAASHLFATFGLLALALAALGIYGVMATAVAQRTREMGIRQALGARPRDLFLGVIQRGLALFLWGTVLGGLASFVLLRAVESLFFGVEATDPWAMGGAWLTLLVALLLACWLPARRAARLDVLNAIRHQE